MHLQASYLLLKGMLLLVRRAEIAIEVQTTFSNGHTLRVARQLL